VKFARGGGAWCLIEIVLDQFSDQVIAVMIECSRWNLPHSLGSWTRGMPDCTITSPGCRPSLLTAER